MRNKLGGGIGAEGWVLRLLIVCALAAAGCGSTGSGPGDVNTDKELPQDQASDQRQEDAPSPDAPSPDAVVPTDTSDHDDKPEETKSDVAPEDIADHAEPDLVQEVGDEDSSDITPEDLTTDVGYDQADPDVTPPALLMTIIFEEGKFHVPVGGTLQLKATGVYDDASQKDITDNVTWEVSDPFVAQVSTADGSKGLLTANNPGVVTVLAQLGGILGTVDVLVEEALPVGLTIEPADPLVLTYVTQPLVAYALLETGLKKDVSAETWWESSNPLVATVENTPGQQGMLSALTAGTTEVQAQWMSGWGFSATTLVTVQQDTVQSLSVMPESNTVIAGNTAAYVALATFTSGVSMQLSGGVVWSTENPTIASPLPPPAMPGNIRGNAEGQTKVFAEIDGAVGEAVINVTAAIPTGLIITPSNPGIARDDELQLEAKATFSDGAQVAVTANATWNTTDATIVQLLSGVPGKVKGLKIGQATVSASWGSFTAQTTVKVLFKNGWVCEEDTDCASGRCEYPGAYVPAGYCCPTDCIGGCRECKSGSCQPVAAQTDPYEVCMKYTCDGNGGCKTSCTGDAGNCSADCTNGWCWAGQCQEKLNGGAACVGGCQCKSGTCFPFVCW